MRIPRRIQMHGLGANAVFELGPPPAAPAPAPVVVRTVYAPPPPVVVRPAAPPPPANWGKGQAGQGDFYQGGLSYTSEVAKAAALKAMAAKKGMPWWLWLVIGGGALYAVSHSK